MTMMALNSHHYQAEFIQNDVIHLTGN